MGRPLGLGLGAVILALVGASGVGAQGPDLVIIDTTEIARHGTVGGITGYSLSATTCNLGNDIANWDGASSLHPVIGAQLYRREAGRFEQIGMSWLKHTFCAGNLSSCGPCSGSFCEFLEPGCSDFCSAQTTGSQAFLGPRSEIDATTGSFPFPFATQGQGGDAIYKRLQVRVEDLDPALHPGAEYFAEIQILSSSETGERRFNSVSHRCVEVGAFSNGGFELAFGDPTVPEAPALLAWADADPLVEVEEVTIPGDGRFLLASRVAPLTGGLFSYEYALYNMTSDRSARSFSLPVAPGISVTDPGFHDVDYHSGEPYSGDDWTGTQGGGSLTWSTETFAANEDANALRWSTTYSFRFVADAPPVPAVATIGLFKPGTPDAVTVLTRGPLSPMLSVDLTAAPTTGPAPLAVQFTSLTGGVIDSYEWDFGDGATSDEAHPLHEYTDPGIYTVSLTVTGPQGTATATVLDLVEPLPPTPLLRVPDFQASFGQTPLTLELRGSYPQFLSAFSASLSYPEDILDGVECHLDGTYPEEFGAEFLLCQIDDVGEGSMTVEVIMDVVPTMGGFLPPAVDELLVQLVFDVTGSFQDGETREIAFVDGLGADPVFTQLVDVGGGVIIPETEDGTITFENQGFFLRGNCDGQGNIQLPDAILVLNVIFVGASPPPCLKACDFDDSGTLQLPDGVGLLLFIFAGGNPPMPPFPVPGPDPTPDALPCD